MRLSYRIALALAVAALFPTLPLAAQGIASPTPYPFDPVDTSASPWLPSIEAGPAGKHGFVQRDAEGELRFEDGTPARFFGTVIGWQGVFPDSADAIVTARRLAKLGVNLVRLETFDHAYDWIGPGATLLDPATGYRRIAPAQMRRLDWFAAQLKANGIYLYLPLQSVRVPRAEDGLGANADSLLWLDRWMGYLYPQPGEIHRSISRQLLEHVNPFTGVAWKDEPAVAMLEMLQTGSLISIYRIGWTEHRLGVYGFSWRHSRRLDTLWNQYLQKRYGTDAALRSAWSTPEPMGGFPNLFREGSFEGDFQSHWSIDGYNGTTVTTILTQNDSTPAGDLALKLRVRGTSGNVYTGYMLQSVELGFNRVYRLSFQAKSSNPDGRRIVLGAYQTGEGGMGAGLSASVDVHPWWERQEVLFLVPINSSVPINIVFWYGEKDGDLLIDDLQLRQVAGIGLLDEESLATAGVQRIPWGNGANYLVSPQRVVDQTSFYRSLEAEYLGGLADYVRDSIGSRQLLTGAGHSWSSGAIEAGIQGAFDFTEHTSQWDWVSSENHPWMIRNYSPLRQQYAVTFYTLATSAHRRQPFVARVGSPFPNRFQSELMTMLPAYASLQQWDVALWDRFSDNPGTTTSGAIDSLDYMSARSNPVLTTLMPTISHLFRNRLIRSAMTTIGLQRTREQIDLVPRMESSWGAYAVPGGLPGYASAMSRVVIDSTDAVAFTQANDISFPAAVPGEVMSDTRELLWEYGRGTLTIDAPGIQGASGLLDRAGGITLSNIDVTLLNPLPTTTILWAALDSGAILEGPGRSLLTVVSRTEPSGMTWSDTTYAPVWGGSPMVIEPVRARITLRPNDSLNVALVAPLDASGNPVGEPMRVVARNREITFTLDQSQQKSLIYGVTLLRDAAASAPAGGHARLLSVRPNIIERRGYIDLDVGAPVDHMTIDIYDLEGRLQARIHEGALPTGEGTFPLDAAQLPNGSYIVRALADGEIFSTPLRIAR